MHPVVSVQAGAGRGHWLGGRGDAGQAAGAGAGGADAPGGRAGVGADAGAGLADGQPDVRDRSAVHGVRSASRAGH